jgi:long-chain acyl-CoA synthetase
MHFQPNPTQHDTAQALAEQGLLSPSEAARLDAMVGPTAVLTGCAATSQELAAEAAKLNANPAIVRAVMGQVAAALAPGDGEGDGEEGPFRPWEQVKGVHLLLEPLGVTNGLLTQTLKVRRNVVAERYAREVEGIYK